MGSSLNDARRMAAQEYGVPAAKAVAEGGLQNATMVPESMVSGSKGVVDTVAANLSPVPSPFATIAAPPPVAPAQVTANTIASANALIPDMALAFFLGGVMVIVVLICYEIYLRKK
jgi:hypothetical protein